MRRGLRGLGSQAMPLSLATATPSTPGQIASVAASVPGGSIPSVNDVCSTWDFFFNPGTWKSCADAVNQAQIQSVANNAVYFYGANSPSAITAQQVAAQQEAMVPQDVNNAAEFYGAGQLLYTPGGIDSSGMFGVPWWMWGLGFAALLVTVK